MDFRCLQIATNNKELRFMSETYLILGGSNSGKSRFAEQSALSLQKNNHGKKVLRYLFKKVTKKPRKYFQLNRLYLLKKFYRGNFQ